MRKCMAIAAVVLACVSGAQADVDIKTVPVGTADNAGPLSGAGGYGPDRICGAVGHTWHVSDRR